MADVQPLRRQHGILASAARFPWLKQWREPYLLALALPWPLFLLALALLYFAINLIFALLYRLDPVGLAGSRTGGAATLAEAFFFSVQTLGSLDYSPLRPVDGWAHLEVTAESLTGLLFVALTASLAFARFSRSRARIRFSRQALVHPYNGVPTLVFRVGNALHTGLLEARLQAFLAVDEVSAEGHRLRRMRPLPLERDRGVAFLLVWTAMHRIDHDSPLHGLSPADLQRLNAEVLVAFSGVDETIERTVHARASWPVQSMEFGACFVDVLTGNSEIDWAGFDAIRPCPVLQPVFSA